MTREAFNILQFANCTGLKTDSASQYVCSHWAYALPEALTVPIVNVKRLCEMKVLPVRDLLEGSAAGFDFLAEVPLRSAWVCMMMRRELDGTMPTPFATAIAVW